MEGHHAGNGTPGQTVALVAGWVLSFTDPVWRSALGDKLQRELPVCGANLARVAIQKGATITTTTTAASTTSSKQPSVPDPTPPPSLRCAPPLLTSTGLTQPTRRHILRDWGANFFKRVMGIKLSYLRCLHKYLSALSHLPIPRLPWTEREEEEEGLHRHPSVHTLLQDFVVTSPQHACKWVSRRVREGRGGGDGGGGTSGDEATTRFLLQHIRSATVAKSIQIAKKGRPDPSLCLRLSGEQHWGRLASALFYKNERGVVVGKAKGRVEAHLFACVVYRLYCVLFYFAANEGFCVGFWECAVEDAVSLVHFGVEALETSCQGNLPRSRSNSGVLSTNIPGQVFLAWYVKLGFVVIATPDNPGDHQVFHDFFAAYIVEPLLSEAKAASVSDGSQQTPSPSPESGSVSPKACRPDTVSITPEPLCAGVMQSETSRVFDAICRDTMKRFAGLKWEGGERQKEDLCGVDTAQLDYIMQNVGDALKREQAEEEVRRQKLRARTQRYIKLRSQNTSHAPTPPATSPRAEMRARRQQEAQKLFQQRVSSVVAATLCLVCTTVQRVVEADPEERALLWFSVSEWPDPAENPLAAALSRELSVSDLHHIRQMAVTQVCPVAVAAGCVILCEAAVNLPRLTIRSVAGQVMQKRRKAKKKKKDSGGGKEGGGGAMSLIDLIGLYKERSMVLDTSTRMEW